MVKLSQSAVNSQSLNEEIDSVEDFFCHAMTEFEKAIEQVESSDFARKNASSSLIDQLETENDFQSQLVSKLQEQVTLLKTETELL